MTERTLIATGKFVNGKAEITLVSPPFAKVFRQIPGGGVVWDLVGRCCLCGHEGELCDCGSLGYHCYWCGAKVLCQENRYV